MNMKLFFFPLSLIVLIWSIIGVTKPSWDEYILQKNKVVKLNQEKAVLETGIANIKKALMAYHNINDDIKSYVNNALPMNSDDDNLVAEINKNISQSGVLVIKVDANKKNSLIDPKCQQSATNGDVSKCMTKASITQVTLSATGTYPMLKHFISKLDTQNRIIIPTSINLASSNNKENADAPVKLITAKIAFDVFQKKPAKVKSFSAVMASDAVLQSLLQKGLNNEGLAIVNKFVTSGVFTPVQVESVGKDDLFGKNNGIEISGAEENNQSTI